jgi:CheY-like chemotaxis protein
VLLDLLMPGMDGYDLARRLRGRAAGKRPLLVAVSGCASPDDHRKSAQAGIDLHLDKPVDPGVLVGVLRRFERVLAPT